MSNEKKKVWFPYISKNVTSEFLSKLEVVDIEKVLNMNNKTPVVHSWTDDEIVKTVLNQSDSNSDSEYHVNTAEKWP